MRLTINTETDTYEQAIAAVQAAYGKRPAVPGGCLYVFRQARRGVLGS